MIHFARVDHSPRLQRVLELLEDGVEHTTKDIIKACDVCAVNSIISELRRNGCEIVTRDNGFNDSGAHVYSYRWLKKELQLSAGI